MSTTGSAAYRALLSAAGADSTVTCVVADSTIPFAFDIADELGIPSLAFVTHSACSYLALLSMPKLVELGETAFPADDLVRGVPGMEGFLRRRDLPRGLCCAEKCGEDPLVLKLAEVTARSSKARALIVNTAASMERSALAHIASCTADVFAQRRQASARAPSSSVKAAGTPWLAALKKPTRRHAAATAAPASGVDRSTFGSAATSVQPPQPPISGCCPDPSS
ncbi:hypothetical protein ZWY2020_001844 [Hordeum vulgare]|nr:hypothetical protein ZWY2020_001844 [Hordeum vulgare]